MNPFKLGRGLRSGLCRLRVWLLHHVFTRDAAVHIVTEVTLSLLLHPVLLSLGVLEPCAALVAASCAYVVAKAINERLNKEADG